MERKIPKNPMKPGKKRNKAERLKDRILIAKLYLQGKSTRSISQHIGTVREYTLSNVTVAKDIKKIVKEWQKQESGFIHQAKLIQLEKLNFLESEAWEAYDKTKKFQAKGDNRSAKFLELILKCIGDRSKILGLDQTTQINNQQNVLVVKLMDNTYADADTDGEQQQIDIN